MSAQAPWVPQAPWVRMSARWALVVTFLALLMLTGAPAQAHGGSLPDGQYFTSTIDQVDPVVPGLDLTMVRNGESITLVNRTGRTVQVLGYLGEPYLRFTPDGVEQNEASPSARLNRVPVVRGFEAELAKARGTAIAPPRWRRVSVSPRFTWHDHRVHWMSARRPDDVRIDPRSRHVVRRWQWQLTVDDRPVTVRGALVWTGEPALGGMALAVVVTVAAGAVAGAVLLVARRRARRFG